MLDTIPCRLKFMNGLGAEFLNCLATSGPGRQIISIDVLPAEAFKCLGVVLFLDP